MVGILDEILGGTLDEWHCRADGLLEDGDLSLARSGAGRNMVDGAFRSCRPRVCTMKGRM